MNYVLNIIIDTTAFVILNPVSDRAPLKHLNIQNISISVNHFHVSNVSVLGIFIEPEQTLGVLSCLNAFKQTAKNTTF